MVIYGGATKLTSVSLEFNNIIFKQTPYDIKVLVVSSDIIMSSADSVSNC
jgi:hypothetical protein